MFYQPVPELNTALDYYCKVLGWDEHWREGDTTAAVSPVNGNVTLMLDVSSSDSDAPGPILTVDDVQSWVEKRRPQLVGLEEPAQIPGGWWASFADPFGGRIYLIDQSTEQEPTE